MATSTEPTAGNLRRFEVVYRDELAPSGENCYWRTARTADEAMATVPGAIRAHEVPTAWAISDVT